MKRLIYSMAIISILAMAGCNLSSSSFNIHDKLATAAGNTITLSGSLALGSTAKSVKSTAVVAPRVAVNTYKLYCVTFEESPTSASGSADSTGAFNLSMEGARNAPFGCFIQKIADNSVVATMVFENPNQSGMNGGSQQQGQITLTGSADLGTVTIDIDRGTAVVDISKIKLSNSNDSAVVDTSTLSSDKLFDYTGTWNMGPFQGTLPPGYLPLPTCCTPGDVNCHSDGPCVNADGTGGFDLFMKRIIGKEWKYNGSEQSATDWTTGVTTSNKVYGVMVWASKDGVNGFNSCGNALGVTNNDAKRYGRIDFTDFVDGTNLKFVYDATTLDLNGNLARAFKWTDEVLDGGPVTVTMNDGTQKIMHISDGWQDTSATMTSNNNWIQTTLGEVFDDTNGNGWYDSSEPWNDFYYPIGDSRRENGIVDAGEFEDWNGNGVRDTGEKYYDGVTTYTDVNNNGKYDDGDVLGPVGTNPTVGQYDWGHGLQIPAGGKCLDIKIWNDLNGNGQLDAGEPYLADTDPVSLEIKPFAQARCYANALQNIPQDSTLLCIKNMNFNWRANTLKQYMNANSGPVNPKSLYIFEKFVYTSIKSGSFTQVQKRENGFDYTDNNGQRRWVSCQLEQKMEFNLTFIDSNTMIGDMKQSAKILPVSEGSDGLCISDSEPFADANGNKTYDPGEVFINIDGSKDGLGADSYTATGFHAWVEQRLGTQEQKIMFTFVKK